MNLTKNRREFLPLLLLILCCTIDYADEAGQEVADVVVEEVYNTTQSNSDTTTPSDDASSQEVTLSEEPEKVEEEDLNLLTEDEYESQETAQTEEEASIQQTPTLDPLAQLRTRRIKDIIVQGNKHVPTAAILTRVSYHQGDLFDPKKSRELIKRLYNELKRFRFIEIKVEPIGTDELNLYIVVEEKKLLKDYQFIGNTQIATKDILSKIPFSQMPAIDPEELKVLRKKIKKLYAEKGYNAVDIDAQITLDQEDKATAIFTFHEYPKSLVKRIKFTGNKNVRGKALRSVIFSHEDWLLGFLDQSGIYQPDRVAADRHMIEQYYQNQGYISAKVLDVQVNFDECNNITLVFDIDEGKQYTIGDVSVESAGDVSAQTLLDWIPLKPGNIYSRDQVVDSIKMLEYFWGNRGYIFASVEPAIVPHEDTQAVDITFSQDLGSQVYLNRLNIIGNKKTRDKIIRRSILLCEGELITNHFMEESKNRVEGLGYFEVRDGVNWKINRLGENLADLDLIVKEGKTGHAAMQLGYGGTASLSSPADALTAELNVNDTNFMGLGISVNLAGRFAKAEKTFNLNITQPWLFDKPIMAALDVYHKRTGYEEFQLTNGTNEIRTGGSFTTGFVKVFPKLYFTDIFMRFTLGLDGIEYTNVPVAAQRQDPQTGALDVVGPDQYTALLQKLFSSGSIGWLGVVLGQEKKNHPMHPSRGYAWAARTNAGFPAAGILSYGKFDWDFHWYTPLIGEHDLVFHWHNYLGFAYPLKNKLIPFGELFHIGGPSSVRGYLFGQISPRFRLGTQSDSVGASNALFVNAELLFPIQTDMSIKGVFFYDGGTGWHNPYVNPLNRNYFINNNFDYRHAVGAGIRLTQPMPVKIDVGFKLDPRPNESPYEVHLGMNYGW
ncbi:MAG: outer membrane protein assembly factor BamA [Candidatus Dependentiae bacterium]|nr:outer membrane protein assembly factor BamA [Candidatus Dependentiae bacterium]